MRILFAALILALAGPTAGAECLLQVRGIDYIDGPCDFDLLDEDGSFVAKSQKGEGDVLRFAYVYVDAGSATGFWNGEPAESHAHDPLGELTRDGGCWRNDEVKVCAYK